MAFFELDEVFAYQDANDIKRLWASVNPPDNPGLEEVWLDVSASVPLLKRYNGGGWEIIGEVTPQEILSKLAGVDGTGSGLDADTLDGTHGAGYIKKDIDQTTVGRVVFNGGNHTWDGTGSRGALECRTPNGTDPAIMCFIRPGVFGVYLGLDTDNSLKVGGWSMGANKYKLWHQGNDGPGSGLDADTVDGVEASGLVKTSGTQTIAGDKTFTGTAKLDRPVIPIGKPSGAVDGTIWIE